MIDWLSFRIDACHDDLITGGTVLCINQDGEMEWATKRRRSVVGSWDSSLQVRTYDVDELGAGRSLEVSGNPVKWLQGHNLFGTDDLFGLVGETMLRLSSLLGIPQVTTAAIDAAILTRVDVTQSFTLANRAEVLAWIRAAEQTAHLSHRGRGQLVKGSTLYFGKNSRRWSLKIYSKGQEVAANPQRQPAIADLPKVHAWADNVLRAELTLRSLELKRTNMHNVSSWGEDSEQCSQISSHLLMQALGKLTMTTTNILQPEVLHALKPAAATAALAWENGADLRNILPRATFYRYRRQLLAHGIDLATRLPRDVSNVVPLHKVLEAKPAAVPGWAIGTSLYFQPRYFA